MLLFLFFLTVVHEDHKSRFRITLPDGWKWNPQPGDTHGTWFKKLDTGALGNFAVRVAKMDKGGSVDKIVFETEKNIVDEPGYRKLSETQTTIAGRPATRKEYTMYVSGSERTQKRVEDYFLQNNDYAFWLHFESGAEGFDLFHDDVVKMVNSFVPLSGGQTVSLIGGAAAQLIGRWQKVNDAALIMELKSDGTYTLGPAAGTFTAEKGTLLLRMLDGEERFNVVLQGDELVVSGPNLDVPIRYKKLGVRKVQKLAGVWKARDKVHSQLRLSPGGQVTFGSVTGNYQLKGDLLVIRSGESEKIYTVFLDGDVLKLSGADLSGEAIFDRAR